MKSFKEAFLAEIEQYDAINIYRHIHPDGDALGSQWGLATWIKDNYPHKAVYVKGTTEADYSKDIFPAMSTQMPETYLSIVVDTSNSERIDDVSYSHGEKVIKIDHHPVVESYGDLNFEIVSAGSASEIIASLLLSYHKTMSAQAASYLLSGIMTDTAKFTIEATTSDTLRVAAELMDKGANISKLSQQLFSRSYEGFLKGTKIGTHIRYEAGVAYYILNQEDIIPLNISAQASKRYIGLMAGVKEFKIWCSFVQTEDQTYSGSIRSQQATVNDICAEFGGGGHRLACGVKGLSHDDVRRLIKKLEERVKES